MTIDQINFSDLKPYDGKTSRSFELLIYRLMVNAFGNLGVFTSIAGEGGDGGVEFYLTLENGDVHGWQCKYYPDKGRLAESGRKQSIQKSLKTACRNYPNLKKWTLCLKTNLTRGSTDANSTYSEGEKDWFDKVLPLSIAATKNVVLHFLGEDQILTMLGSPLNYGISSFFFGQLEVNQDWFKVQTSETLTKTKEKYDPVLHTIDLYTQSIIDSALMNPGYKKLITELSAEIVKTEPQIIQDISRFALKVAHNTDDAAAKDVALGFFKEFNTLTHEKQQLFHKLTFYIENYDLESLNLLIQAEQKSTRVADYLNKYPQTLYDDTGDIAKRANSIYRAIRRFFEEYDRVFRNYVHSMGSLLIFLGDAASGKTHLSSDIAYCRLANRLPVIFLTADSFNNESNLEQALLKLLNIPTTYSFDHFLQTLETFGAIANVKVPIIIDALNETVFGRYFSTIWKTHFNSLANKISLTKNVVLITTCRTSYKEEIWDATRSNAFHYLDGFMGYEITKEAIEKYFNKYLIKTDLTFANISRFQKPIFLKIFCEIKNPEWTIGKEVFVNIETNSNNDLFTAYFDKVNQKVVRENHFLRPRERFIQESMEKIARYLWENNLREIPVNDFHVLMDGNNPYRQGESRADILINEGLVLTRDFRHNEEFVSVTYEIIAGFIIADYLVRILGVDYLIPEGPFHQKVNRAAQPHPLYENIIGELALLLPQATGTMLHDIYGFSDDSYINYISIRSLWELPGSLVRDQDVNLVEAYFLDVPENRSKLIPLFKITLSELSHPLNSYFLSSLLFELSVKDRDLSWTEYVRRNYTDWEYFLNNLIEECASDKIIPSIVESRIHLVVSYAQWLLTSTNRELRDLATKALYYYGKKYPRHFAKLVYTSLECNDPYVWERTLGALYGVVLSKQRTKIDKDFQRDILPEIGTSLFKLIFEDNAQYYTTHILARDYASHCIQVALTIHPDLVGSNEDVKKIHAPFQQSLSVTLPVHPDGANSFGGPIGMDFGNYTIGHIVKEGFSYSNPPEKITTRGQIYSRIYQLGWNIEEFKSLDRDLQDNFSQNRSERPKVERYGKKYSWIAFMEVAGYRDDKGLLDKEFKEYRSTDADIDPCFPEKELTGNCVTTDFLGDRTSPLIDWLKTKHAPSIDQYLAIEENGASWICLDGYINQADELADRALFLFIRGMIVKNTDASSFLTHLIKQRLGGRWISEIRENYYSFAGEFYLFPEATHDNYENISFELSRTKKRVKIGEPGYHPKVTTEMKAHRFTVKTTYPKSIVIDDVAAADFNILLPVMEYNWGHGRSPVNILGQQTIVAKEIAAQIKLEKAAHTFDLYDENGTLATMYKDFNGDDSDDGNSNRFAFLRKDLLDKYLAETDSQLIWGIWGEREPKLEFTFREVFNKKHGVEGFFEFQDVKSYQ